MAERPIIFSDHQVRAILEGRQWQTRRPVDMERLRIRLPRIVQSEPLLFAVGQGLRATPGVYRAQMNPHGAVAAILLDGQGLGVRPGEFHFCCPYADGQTVLADHGQDQRRWTILPEQSTLWVREAWRMSAESNHTPDGQTGTKRLYVDYRAGAVAGRGQQRSQFRTPDDDDLAVAAWGKGRSFTWRPSIHMPRWASRLTLTVTATRMERIQDITCADIRVEGVRCPEHDFPGCFCCSECSSLRQAFAQSWDATYGKKPGKAWGDNPRVWALTFEPKEKNRG